MDGLFRALEIEDEQIQTDALMALSDTPAIAYEVIQEYIPKIKETTVKFLMNNEKHKQSKNILQFWTNLCHQE